MPINDSRSRKLSGILAQENSKKGTFPGFAAAKFRDTALDTHETLPPQYFGPPRLPPPERLSHRSPSVGTMMREEARMRKVSSASARLTQETPLFSSVFKPTIEQSHVTGLAATRRHLVANSEWAQLDSLEIELLEQERRQQALMQAEQKATMRHNLDAQVRAKELQAHIERMDKMNDGQMMDMFTGTQRFREQEVKKAEAARQRMTQTLAGRDSQVAARGAARVRAFEDKLVEERKILAKDKEAVETARQQTLSKASTLRTQTLKEMQEAEARKVEVAVAVATRKAQDEDFVVNAIRSMERLEQERERARIEKLERDDRRQTLVDKYAPPNERAAMQVEEERRRQVAIEKAEALARQKEVEQKIKKASTRHAFQSDHQAWMARKAREAVEADVEMARDRVTAHLKDLEDKAAHEAQLRAIRERSESHANVVNTQRLDRETFNISHDVGMTEQEKLVNRKLLDQARQLAVKASLG